MVTICGTSNSIQADRTNLVTTAPIHYNNLGSIVSTTNRDVWFDVKEPVGSFTGRTRELKLLREAIKRCHSKDMSTVISTEISISGLGGVAAEERERELKIKMEENAKKAHEDQAALKQEMKNKAEAGKKLKTRLLSLAENKNDVKECISNYLEEIKIMISKTSAFQSYADKIAIKNFSGFLSILTKIFLSLAIVPVVELLVLKSKLNNLIEEMELFESKQKYTAKKFLAINNQEFSIVLEPMECPENFGEDCTSNILNSISISRSVQLVMLDVGSYIRLFRESWGISDVVSLSIQFIEALNTEKRQCESILAKVN